VGRWRASSWAKKCRLGKGRFGYHWEAFCAGSMNEGPVHCKRTVYKVKVARVHSAAALMINEHAGYATALLR